MIDLFSTSTHYFLYIFNTNHGIFVFYFQGEILKLEFLEEGKYYNQTMMLNENSIEFDVPQHANIQETHYLYDYEAVSP